MEWLLFIALSAIAAILFNPVSGFVNKQASGVQNSAAQQFLGSYAGRTAVTTVAFFIVLVTAASVMSLVGGKKAADVPTLV